MKYCKTPVQHAPCQSPCPQPGGHHRWIGTTRRDEAGPHGESKPILNTMSLNTCARSFDSPGHSATRAPCMLPRCPRAVDPPSDVTTTRTLPLWHCALYICMVLAAVCCCARPRGVHDAHGRRKAKAARRNKRSQTTIEYRQTPIECSQTKRARTCGALPARVIARRRLRPRPPLLTAHTRARLLDDCAHGLRRAITYKTLAHTQWSRPRRAAWAVAATQRLP